MTFNYIKKEWWAFNTYKRIWSLEMQEQLPLFAFSPKRGKGGSDYNTSYLEVAAALRHNDINNA